ncbi:hypothetical protein D4R42_01220 [bacterium]|nr:MAG: hypothetical protein D4R42_01220 [bacterium]
MNNLKVGVSLVNCPNCKKEISDKPKKEWRYSIFLVKQFECKHCGQNFKAYYKGNKFSHTIKDQSQKKE